jgi:uncharacterized Zn finger protein
MVMSKLRLWCRTCGRGVELMRQQGGSVILPACETCGPTTWDAADHPDDIKFPWLINLNDKRFLRAIRIDPETDDAAE